MTSIPIADLKAYADWKDAPVGAVVAYASPIFITAPGQSQPAVVDGPRVAIRAKSALALQQFLVGLTPDAFLASQANDKTQAFVLGAVEASDGPAVDVTSQYELRLDPAPAAFDLYSDPPDLTVVQTLGDQPKTLLFAGKVSRSSRYLVLDGTEKGTLIELPGGRVIVLGTLAVVPKGIRSGDGD